MTTLTPPDLTVIILTYNEALHIERCIKTVLPIAKEIFVVDSFSKDDTVNIAERLGAKVVQHPFENQAKQFNWALEQLPIQTAWVLRLDADEYVTKELADEIIDKLPHLAKNVSGVILPFKRIFLGREIKRGTGGIKMLRLFRYGKAVCEQRWMDEHIELLEGETVVFQHEFADDNLNHLSWWTQKHVNYALREAIDLLDMELGLFQEGMSKPMAQLSPQAAAKRRKKQQYAKQPLFWRAFAYFVYRYIFKLGFLEGKEGFLWHFLQGWWYRTLVDAKVWEIKKTCGNNPHKIKTHLKEVYGISI